MATLNTFGPSSILNGTKKSMGISLAYNPTEGCDSPTHILLTSNLKPMNHETKAKLKAALVTGYILLATMTGIAFFGRFLFALITN